RMLSVLLLVLISGSALAQEPTPPPPPPEIPLDVVPEPAPRLPPIRAHREGATLDERPAWARTRAARFLVEMGGGLIGSGLGVALGYGLGCAVTTDSFGRCEATIFPYTMILGFAAGLAPGVWLAGEVAGAGGTLAFAVLGEIAGGLALIPAFLVTNAIFSSVRSPPDLLTGAVGTIIVLIPYLVTVGLYETSAKSDPEDEHAARAPKIFPLAGTTKEGGFTAGLGLFF
ncbi:MAG: hypothetical protein ACJ790_09015, partial [Myxococcaceae bacterium]